MANYIDRQAAIDAVMECYDNDELFEVYEWKLNELQPIQPDIVRCKDCKHFESEYGYCDYYQWNMTGCDFCSKAEKREVTE